MDIVNLPKQKNNSQQEDNVSFQHPTYNAIAPVLDFLLDVWTGKTAWYVNQKVNDLKKAELYLPREAEEPTSSYQARLARSRFERLFRSAIEQDLSGLLSRFSLVEPPESFDLALNNIDLQGNHLEVFLKKLDELALRDGAAFVLVDFPKENPDRPIITEADRLEVGNQPYLVLISRANLINWHYQIGAGGLYLDLVVIKETASELIGNYQIEEKIRYRVLRPGSYEIYEEVDDELVQIESGATNLPIIPVIAYSFNSDGTAFESDFPLADLADLNLSIYQLESSRRELLHRLALPVLIVNDLQPEFSSGEDDRPITIGSNTVLRNVSGDTKFIEPQGTSLAISQQEQLNLEQAFNRKVLNFIGLSDQSKTATQASLEAAHSKASLQNLAKAKESLIQTIFSFWVLYTGEALSEEAACKVDLTLLNPQVDLSFNDLVNAVTSGLISRKFALEVLRERGVIPEEIDLEEELATLETQGAIANQEGQSAD